MVYFFLKTVPGNKPVNKNILLLAYPEGPVGGLVLHRGVVPEIIMDNPAGPGKVKPQAPRFKTDKEDPPGRIVLKGIDRSGTLLLPHAAVVDKGGLPKFACDDRFKAAQCFYVLAEDQGLLPVVDNVAQKGKEQHRLARKAGYRGAFLVKDPGMIADLLQGRKEPQHQGRTVAWIFKFFRTFHGIVDYGFVKGQLILFQPRVFVDGNLFRQIGDDGFVGL